MAIPALKRIGLRPHLTGNTCTQIMSRAQGKIATPKAGGRNNDTQLFLSFPPEDTTVSARISDCLADISTWMKNHHLQLNLAKTELMVLPAKQAIHHNISINIDSLSLVPSKTARNLGVIIDDQLTFTDHIASVSRSCRFALFNIRKIRPYLTQYATQLLVQTLVNS